MKREPGFMGLAKQNARKEGMFQVPKRYQPQGGEEEYPAFVTQKEMAMLKQQGGSGHMTPYGVPSFNPNEDASREDREPGGESTTSVDQNSDFGSRGESERNWSYDPRDIGNLDIGGWMKDKFGGGGGGTPGYVPPESGGGGGGGNSGGYTPPPPKTPEQIEAERKAKAKEKYDAGNKKREEGQQGKTWDRERKSAVRGTMKDAEGRTVDQQGVMTDASGKVEGDEGFDFETATLQGGYDESTGKMDISDSYEGYKQEAKGLGKDAKGLTEGVMTDASGKTEGQEGYDAGTASMQGGFAGDVKKLGAYQSKFDQMGADAKTRGDAGEKFQQEQGVKYSDEAGKGQTAASEAASGIKTATQQGQTAAGQGAEGYQAGATDVGVVKDQFGQDGFQKEAGGYQSQIGAMADKAMSGDVGQSQAAMLKGQMEEGRMASQKGSEEKLRREMAQSGASPAEIASKVAQFQQSSAGQQAQAGRSEALSSQLQGQQMGQAQLGQAAGLTGQAMGALGQKAGMAGQQASLGAQQAALRGQAAGMQMQGAQMGMSGAQQAGQMGMAGAQMGMQGAQGNAAMNAQGVQIGQAGANQQANMMGQGMGAVQAAGAARGQQMAGLGTQGQFIDQQGNYTQAQLNDTMAQQTQQYSADQAEATRKANAAANSGGGGGGGGFNLFKPSSWSDIRLKDNIKLLEEGKGGDPNIYSFKYKWDSDTTWSGVMAQELLDTKHADAVETHPNGYYMVDYGKLGIEMTQLSAKEQHGV